MILTDDLYYTCTVIVIIIKLLKINNINIIILFHDFEGKIKIYCKKTNTQIKGQRNPRLHSNMHARPKTQTFVSKTDAKSRKLFTYFISYGMVLIF